MIEHIKGDALEWASKEGYCLLHVCNNKGVFGGGKTAVATQVKERFPLAYERYKRKHSLGKVTADGTFAGGLNVANLVAQDGYGPRWKKVKYFSEEAFEECLDWLSSSVSLSIMKSTFEIHTLVIPYKMGADRAGGDWEWIQDSLSKKLGGEYNLLIVERDYG